jgi:hypothetical protein
MKNSQKAARARRLVPYAALDPRYETRNIMSRSSQNIRGNLPCSKGIVGVEIESTWEALFALRAEASAAVTEFESQPFQFKAIQADLGIGYTPDAAVTLNTGERCLVEVKREADLNADVLARLAAVRKVTAKFGFRLRCVTDAELNHADENRRIRTVRIHAKTYTRRESEALNGRLGKRTTLTIGDAIALLGSRAAVLHLIANHFLYVDYRQPLTSAAIVSRNPEEAKHDVALFSGW